MSAFYKFLFPMKPDGTAISLLLLALRLLFGGLLLSHGIQKWTNFESMSAAFPDPLGVGHSVSLGLAIFGELFCSIGFILGALYRLATQKGQAVQTGDQTPIMFWAFMLVASAVVIFRRRKRA